MPKRQIQKRLPTIQENAWAELKNAACWLYELEQITASRAAEIIGCNVAEFREVYLAWQKE